MGTLGKVVRYYVVLLGVICTGKLESEGSLSTRFNQRQVMFNGSDTVKQYRRILSDSVLHTSIFYYFIIKGDLLYSSYRSYYYPLRLFLDCYINTSF